MVLFRRSANHPRISSILKILTVTASRCSFGLRQEIDHRIAGRRFVAVKVELETPGFPYDERGEQSAVILLKVHLERILICQFSFLKPRSFKVALQ